MSQTQLQLAYFGKLPSRGDFVKSANNVQLLDTLDRWLAQGMELLAEAPDWKATYDTWQPVQFAFLGSQSRLAIAGTLMASSDLSSRRFPFLTATAMEIERPINFIARSPLALARLWTRAGQQMLSLSGAADATEGLRLLAESQHDVETGAGTQTYDASFSDFIDFQTVAGLEQMLRAEGHHIRLRRTLLALGVLLQPVMSSGSSQLEKGLTLPLPADPLYRSLVASFWLELVSRFLQRADFELSLFLGRINGAERLVIGFNGASSRTLHSIISPLAYAEQNINIDDPEWVDQHVGTEYGMGKFVSYLDQPQLSLRVAVDTFREVFIGE
ncbi:type VI secretion system-associated protein TagF [Ralstonia solanacearum]|uniref:type VI secretion system-associated protein TagF n=1 Tax=Ralstonia solanacearum TaxID=305 RepID=UPI0001816E41|nr:type VI secretion system-associated protein TagF [Ralstonia solanacearum]MDC6179216.1 type VI secretion system-associated protein TagF [Ralstonia solanacearum]MDC6211938.1 type VI secretion system-associated protein TagF [Ralstonia solanacearum]MDC6240857.1 type VI secretion system-associated protein TagF [Ralstonia solanacearum]MDD7800828.1 type VI secretion system-associated protein TagF [Ralstonia solanacearum]TYZ53388.1 type VI secretion system-associated protein TagF [Ralstonia solanac